MTISASNIEIQPVHSIPKSISMEHIEIAILLAYRESKRADDFHISVNIRIVGREEGTEINKKFKRKNAPTNVLAFEGDSQVRWFEGNFSEYEEFRRKELGVSADQPQRIKYKKLA